MPTYLGDGTQLRLWGAHFPVIGEYRQCPGIRFDNITRTFISYGDGQFQRHETGRMKASSMNIFLFIWKAALRTENKTEIELPFEEFLNQFFFLDLSGVAGRANDKGVFIGKDGSQVPAAVEAKIRKANQVFNHELLVAVGIALEKQNEFTGDASGGGSGSSSGGSKNTIESIFFCKSIHASLIELITEVNTKLALKTSMSYVPVRQGEPLAAMCTLIGTQGVNLTKKENMLDATNSIFEFLYSRQKVLLQNFKPFELFEELAGVLYAMRCENLEKGREEKARLLRVALKTEKKNVSTRRDRLDAVLFKAVEDENFKVAAEKGREKGREEKARLRRVASKTEKNVSTRRDRLNAVLFKAVGEANLEKGREEKARLRRVASKTEKNVSTIMDRLNAVLFVATSSRRGIRTGEGQQGTKNVGARVGDGVGDAVGDALGNSVGHGLSSSQKIRKEKMSGKVIHCPVCQTVMKCGIYRAGTTQYHWNTHEQCLIGMEAMLEDANHEGWTSPLVLKDKLNYDWVARKKAIEKQLKSARQKARK